MKYLGAALIFFACLGAGTSRALEMRRRVRTLRGLTAALEVMKSEICSRLSPLPQAVEAAASGAPAELAAFFASLRRGEADIGDRSFSDIWGAGCRETLPALGERELAALLGLGASLGRYAAEEQGQAFDACAAILGGALRTYETALSGGMRTAVGVWAALGAMTVITLF